MQSKLPVLGWPADRIHLTILPKGETQNPQGRESTGNILVYRYIQCTFLSYKANSAFNEYHEQIV